MIKKITVFTPTYNREKLLARLYDSLCAQSSNDFIWLIVDDGSTDNTEHVVRGWIDEQKIQIQYLYKKNGGMHTAHNLAYKSIITELNVCIDSDDWMPSNAIQLITDEWNKVLNKDHIAGIVGLDADKKGNIIGTKLPNHLKCGKFNQLYDKYGVTGDKKIVLRTDIVQKFERYPEFEGEKLVPLGILYLLIDQKYDFLYTNSTFCIVEYQNEGSSRTIFKQYKQSPKGFAYARKVAIRHSVSFAKTFRSYSHLISSAIFASQPRLAFNNVNPLLTILAIPFGVILHLYILIKIKR